MLAKHADRNLTVGRWRVRCSNGYAFVSKIQTRVAQVRRQSIVLAISAILSAGCSAGTETRLGGEGQGGIVADEPHAVTVGAAILSGGGSAADAAVATALALSVTFPVAASLGGGGACLVFDGPTGTAESLEFLPRAAKRRGAVAVPGMIRGLGALHARYGRLSWDDVVKPAEEFARSGHPLSRAMARNIATFGEAIDSSDSLRRWLGGEEGGVLSEGEGYLQVELSSTLSLLRARGAGDLYGGLLGHQFVAATRRLGGKVALEDLRAYAPIWAPTTQAQIGDIVLHTASLPITGGRIAGQVWLMLSDEDRYRLATPDERAHLVAEASLRAIGDVSVAPTTAMSAFRADALMRSYDPSQHRAVTAVYPEIDATLPAVAGADGTTSFVVGDNDGSAVSCTISLGSPFGIGAWDPVTGIVPAASAAINEAKQFAGLILLVREPGEHVFLAAAASGGIGAPVALAQVVVMAADADAPPASVLASGRVLHLGSPDRVIVEPSLSKVGIDGLRARKHDVFRASPIGFVNLLRCSSGLGRGRGGCSYVADPRGAGMGLAQ